MEKKRKLDFQSILLIAAAVIIAALICYMCIEKGIDNKNVAAYETKIVELQQTIGRLYQEIYLGTDDESNEAEEDSDTWYYAWSNCREELDSIYFTDEDITDTMAKILFVRGANIVWSQDVYDLSKFPIADPRVTTEIDGKVYVKRDVLYSNLVETYSRLFTGNLLDEQLNKFIEIDGYIYVLTGAVDAENVGNTAADVEVTRVSESNGEYTYRVKYEIGGAPSEDIRYATMVLKTIGNSFAISSLEFDEDEETAEQDVTEQDVTEQENSEQDVTEQDNTEQENSEQDNIE